MSHIRGTCLVGATCILLGVQSFAAASDEPQPIQLPAHLGLEDAVRIFRGHGLDLLIADAAVDAARADEKQAGAIANPAVGIGGSRTFGYDPSRCSGCSDIGWSASVSDQAALADGLSGKRGLRLRVARAAVDTARMARADAERSLSLQVRQQYLQALLARDTLDFAKEQQSVLDQLLDLNRTRYHSGAISEADVLKVETAKLESDQDVDAASQGLDMAKATLAYLLGARGTYAGFEVDADLPRFVVPAAFASVSRETLLARAFANRPDWRGQEYQVARASASVASADRLWVPDVAITVQGAGQGTGQNAIQPPTITLGLSAPIPILYRFEGERQHAAAELRTQAASRAKLAAQITSDVAMALAEFSATRRRLERMEGQLLDRAVRTRDLVRLQYEKGAASLLELLDAQRAWSAANLEHLRDLSDYWSSVFALESAIASS